jgi:hypothetical protein
VIRNLDSDSTRRVFVILSVSLPKTIKGSEVPETRADSRSDKQSFLSIIFSLLSLFYYFVTRDESLIRKSIVIETGLDDSSSRESLI